MTVAADHQTGGVAPGGPLVDVSGMSVRDIFGEETVLAGALERLEVETRSHEDLFAGFGNFAPDDDPPPTLAA
jgi:hypothetical protein